VRQFPPTFAAVRSRAARGWRDCGHDLLRALATEGSEKTRYECIYVCRRHVDVGGVVLGSDGDGPGSGCVFRALRPTALKGLLGRQLKEDE
jgi:hypothetical protein